jgi:hypothetical protein
MGASHSIHLPYVTAVELLNASDASLVGTAYKRMTDKSNRLTIEQFQRGFIRPSVSGVVSRRLFATMVSQPTTKLLAHELQFNEFLACFVTLCRASATAREQFAFAWFGDCLSTNSVEKTAFCELYANVALMAMRMGFKLPSLTPCTGKDGDIVASATRDAEKCFSQFAQKKPTSMTFDEFSLWAEHGTNDVYGSAFFCFSSFDDAI